GQMVRYWIPPHTSPHRHASRSARRPCRSTAPPHRSRSPVPCCPAFPMSRNRVPECRDSPSDARSSTPHFPDRSYTPHNPSRLIRSTAPAPTPVYPPRDFPSRSPLPHPAPDSSLYAVLSLCSQDVYKSLHPPGPLRNQ